jgi:hypothetical protein
LFLDNQQALNDLLVGHVVVGVGVEVHVLRQHMGNDLEDCAGWFLIVASMAAIPCCSYAACRSSMNASPSLFLEPLGRPGLLARLEPVFDRRHPLARFLAVVSTAVSRHLLRPFNAPLAGCRGWFESFQKNRC